MLQIFGSSNINFIGHKNKAFIFSGLMIAATIISLLIPRGPSQSIGPNWSIDFVGGTLLQFKFEIPVADKLGQIRAAVDKLGFGQPEVKTIGRISDNEIQIIVKRQGEGSAVADQIREALGKEFDADSFELRRQEKVGAKIGGELQRNAVIAILLSLLAIVIYIGIRFHLPFGIAAIGALFHDVIVTIGVFSVVNAEFSLPIIAALLTIVGYSLNDTIVVFDRIRENMGGTLIKKSFEDRVNASINQCLSRTVITSFTTFIVVATIYAAFFGSGDVIKDFALALLVGVIVGTYSSIYIASPLLVLWNRKWPLNK